MNRHKPIVRALRSIGVGASIVAALPAFATGLELDDGNIPVVLTPARLKQSLADVPGSVTIISSDMLERLNISSVAEALRLVPGMAVTQVSGTDIRVNYLGTNILVPRRLLVLIDGMSVYRPALARVDWKELPVAVEDIARIEVTRGPNSVAYGGDAMMGIVNIITKAPNTVEGTSVKVRVGSLGTREFTARHSGHLGESTDYRVTLNSETDTGYPFLRNIPGQNGEELYRLNARAVTRLVGDDSITTYLSVVNGSAEQPYADRYQKTFPNKNTEEYDVGVKWNNTVSERQTLEVHGYVSSHHNGQGWTTCPPTALFLPEMHDLWRANPAYAGAVAAGRVPKGGTAADDKLALAALGAIRNLGAAATKPTCVAADQNFTEQRSSLELQDTLVLSDSLRLVTGLGAIYESGESQTYLAGSAHNANVHTFANVEYKVESWLNFNAGGFWEYETLNGSEFSPRLGLNIHVSPNHTLRMNSSRGTRLPDIQEQKADWGYRVSNAMPALNGQTSLTFFQNSQAKGGLSGEHNVTNEIGYFGNFPAAGLTLDARLFQTRLYHLISEKLQLTEFKPTNTGAVKLVGSEFQLTYKPSDSWNIYATYSHLNNYDAATPLESTQVSNNSGSLGISKDFSSGWQLGFATYQASGNGIGHTYYGREDLILSKEFRVGPARLTATLMAQHFDNLHQTYFQDIGSTVDARYKRGMQYYATLRAEF
jgi:iron complex outermembrane receptor protein